MEVSNLHVFNSVSGLWEPFTRAMLSGAELTPIGSIASITVTGTASTLSALMTAAGTSIAANCTWIEMRVRDDQTSQTVKLNYTGTATALLYDAAMSRAAGSLEPASLIGRATKTLFDAYSLIATANTVVLVRQYTG